jgi:ribosomal protein L24
LNIKKGDQVKVLPAKTKEKPERFWKCFRSWQKIVVEGLNISVRFSKPKRQGEKGQRMEFQPACLWAKSCCLSALWQTTRVGHEVKDNGNFRKCKNAER